MLTRALALLVLASLSCEGGEGEGIEGVGTTCSSVSPREGEPCDLVSSVTCFSELGDCATAQVCVCRNGAFACEAPDWDASCAGIQNASCAIEGRPGCVGYPTSGETYCEAGAWLSALSCSPGCPIEEEQGRPQTGEPCSVAEGGVCDYVTVRCDCVEGAFACADQ